MVSAMLPSLFLFKITDIVFPLAVVFMMDNTPRRGDSAVGFPEDHMVFISISTTVFLPWIIFGGDY